MRQRLMPIIVVAIGLAVAAGPAATVGPPASAGVSQAWLVSQRPFTWTPHVLDGYVRAIVVVGDVAVVGGRFTSVREAESDQILVRHNLFSFRLGTGEVLDAFAPRMDAPVLALADGQHDTVYVGGSFATVDGDRRPGLVRLRLSDGSPDAGFTAPVPSGEVRDLARRDDQLYVGGLFSRVGGVKRTSLARLDATTGAVDPRFDLHVSRSTVGPPSVERMAVTNDGRLLAVDGSFTSIGGRHRYQVALIDVVGRPQVSSWRTDAFERSACILIGAETTYLRGLDFAPDGSYFVVVTSGHLNEPRKLCDTAVRFNTGPGPHRPVWVNHTGANTLLSVAVTGSAVYVGGHQTWLDNTYGWKYGGPGAVYRPGIGALDPRTGRALPWNPTKDRGNGTQALVAYPGGLLVGSDTEHLGHEYHARLGGFPLPGRPS